MSIVKATVNDCAKIMELIRSCIENMESSGIFQWNENYPTRDIIINDINNGFQYALIEEKEILGIMAINEEQSPEYSSLKWNCNEGRVLVVHRLAVHPLKHRRGIGKRLMEFAERYAKEKEYASIRLDTYSGNPKALRLYEQIGYLNVGQVNFPMRELPFKCYEKVL